MSTKDKSKQDFNIFLSYAIEDSRAASEIKSWLAQEPSFHLFTSGKISAGDNWRSKIKKALSKCDFFLVLLSPTSVQSKWVQFELGAAWGLKKAIIPLVTSPDVIRKIPLDLGDLQVVELKNLEKLGDIAQIIESYEVTLGKISRTAA